MQSFNLQIKDVKAASQSLEKETMEPSTHWYKTQRFIISKLTRPNTEAHSGPQQTITYRIIKPNRELNQIKQ